MQNKNEVSALYESQEDEISLVDVVYFFKNNGKLILSAMFIASLIGGAYALLSPLTVRDGVCNPVTYVS